MTVSETIEARLKRFNDMHGERGRRYPSALEMHPTSIKRLACESLTEDLPGVRVTIHLGLVRADGIPIMENEGMQPGDVRAAHISTLRARWREAGL